MKVDQPSDSPEPADLSAGNAAVRTALRIVALLAVAAVLVILLLVVTRPGTVQQTVADIEERWGYAFGTEEGAGNQKWATAAASYLRDLRGEAPEIPELVIDVPFKEMSSIFEKRDAALERGILVQGADDFVKGTVRIDGRTVPIKLRLKGDWSDHLEGHKWSFRIRVRGDEQLFGMRRFSIQNPGTRGFQSEMLYFEVMRRFGLIVPRYMFVDVTLNGDSMGLMAIEEFFAKEMLENNKRREGVIVRLDESMVWDARDAMSGADDGWGGSFDHFSNAPVDGIGSSRIAESPFLSQQYATAEGLLRAFVEGQLAAAEVFDVPRLAAFIGVSDFFGSWHAVRWHNIRFYLNPISMRLEPIPFDATLQDALRTDKSVIHDEPLLAKALKEPVIWDAYIKVLEKMSEMTHDGSMEKLIRSVEERQLPVLQTEFRMLAAYPTEYLQPRIDVLLENARAAAGTGQANPNLYIDLMGEKSEYPVFAHLGVQQSGSQHFLRVENAIPRDVVITSVNWVNDGTGQRLGAMRKNTLPLPLPPRGIGSRGQRMLLPLVPPPRDSSWALEVTAGFEGRNWAVAFRPETVYPALRQSPVPRVGTPALAAAYLQIDADAQQYTILTGNWNVPESIIVPPGYALKIEPGTTLNFAATAMLIAHGPVEMIGEEGAPIVLQPEKGASWPGLAVMDAAAPSRLAHVVVRDTSGVSWGNWSLTGGVNFYDSDIDIENSSFFDSHGEDALNIIHSRFNIDSVLIRGTASDAFDADFSTGTVNNSRFEAVGAAGGGDAIDVSGSQVSIVETAFHDVSDKALSIGERSDASARNVSIDGAGTGAAAKDGSSLVLRNSSIKNVSFAGLTAYIKKPEYGPAEIIAEQMTISAAETDVLVQTESRVIVDGEAHETTDVDVDALYETIMRKGL